MVQPEREKGVLEARSASGRRRRAGMPGVLQSGGQSRARLGA